MPVQVLFANGTDKLFPHADSAVRIAQSIVLVRWNDRLNSMDSVQAFPVEAVTTAEVLNSDGSVETLLVGRAHQHDAV